ncbi:MAG: phosphatidylglycerophosphatase A [Candidatus Omnitrophica bacterium]|nr:phosphatidylglycerophosphatase A [Candidatus Omnitrophota bacterium]
MRNIAVFIATLGGLGRMRWAPGTWGSLVGLLGGIATLRWFDWPLWALPVSLAVKFVICALICTVAERALGIHDAPAIILDEAWAMAAIVISVPRAAASWPLLLAAFVLFRAFDIVKPFPLKRLARLPSGWGIMADDLGAAAYAVAILLAAHHLIS